MSERDNPWLNDRKRQELERNERRLSFETIMAEVDSGQMTREQAMAVLSLGVTDVQVRTDMEDMPLPGMEGGDV